MIRHLQEFLSKISIKKLIFSLFPPSRGQATVEYILLIALVIFIALLIGGPLGKYLTAFSGVFFEKDNGYYACLTKEGRLPGDSIANCSNSASLLIGGPSFYFYSCQQFQIW